MSGRRAVFLDRDGVVNRALIREGRPYPPEKLDELEILPGVPEAVARFREAGFLVIIVTNQPDLARGRQTASALETLHAAIAEAVPIDAIMVCGHDDTDKCLCRKPKPGMLHAGALQFRIDLATSFMVGDRWRDISAGKAAGCRTFLIGDGYGERFPDPPDAVSASLIEACSAILAGRDAIVVS